MGDLDGLFAERPPLSGGVYLVSTSVDADYDAHTADRFSDKWASISEDERDEDEAWKRFQLDWYLKSYGYGSEAELAGAIGAAGVVLDAGCGPGYKAAWFARLCPDAKIVAMDISQSVHAAARRYADLANLRFVQGDIAATPFRDGVFGLVSCDQVLHHTVSPPDTVREFARILAPGGLLNTYVYARKALPRELLDEHLRSYAKSLTREQLWDLADQLTRLGQTLSELDIRIDVPDMPALGIPGGRHDLQRFIYWNFIKCFWNPQFGFDASRMINFDWYAPSIAYRYSLEEFTSMLTKAGFDPEFLRSEEACHTGRFRI